MVGALLAVPPVTGAQSVIPDTLDWHRYYPLAVGNVWEYQVAEGEPLLRREIIGQVEALGKEYFLMEESSYDYDYLRGGTVLALWRRDTLYVRYDTAGTVVAVRAIEADSSATPQNQLLYAFDDGYFDLRTAFGDTVSHGEGSEDYYLVSGGYDKMVEIGTDSSLVPARKFFQSPFWFEHYAADIGYLGGGNLWGPRMTYSKVGHVQHGSPRSNEVVPDSLDWHGYFPMQVGNVWEYTHSLYRPRTSTRPEDESEVRLERHHIISSEARGDTVVYSLVYQERTEENVPISRDTLDLWYDEASASVVGRSVLPGVLDWLRCLDLPFGALDIPADCWWWTQASEVQVFGEVEASTKGFYTIVYGFEAVHDLGVVSGGGGCEPCSPLDDTDYWSLKYAEIKGTKYGTVIVSTQQDAIPETSGLETYPNPTAGVLNVVSHEGKDVVVYDILGRLVLRASLEPSGKATVDMSPFVRGVYVVTVGSRSRTVVVR